MADAPELLTAELSSQAQHVAPAMACACAVPPPPDVATRTPSSESVAQVIDVPYVQDAATTVPSVGNFASQVASHEAATEVSWDTNLVAPAIEILNWEDVATQEPATNLAAPVARTATPGFVATVQPFTNLVSPAVNVAGAETIAKWPKVTTSVDSGPGTMVLGLTDAAVRTRVELVDIRAQRAGSDALAAQWNAMGITANGAVADAGPATVNPLLTLDPADTSTQPWILSTTSATEVLSRGLAGQSFDVPLSPPCNGPGCGLPPDPQLVFDSERFARNIYLGLNGQAFASADGSVTYTPIAPVPYVGYAVAIFHDTTLFVPSKKWKEVTDGTFKSKAVTPTAEGHAVLGMNNRGVALPYTQHVPQQVASVSKTITLVAMLRAMNLLRKHKKNIDLSTPIFEYFPGDWVHDSAPGVTNITFAELLNGFSGFVEAVPPGEDVVTATNAHKTAAGNLRRLSNLKLSVSQGLYPGYWYPNIGYSICRVLLPYMLSTIPPWKDDFWLLWALYGEPGSSNYDSPNDYAPLQKWPFYVAKNPDYAPGPSAPPWEATPYFVVAKIGSIIKKAPLVAHDTADGIPNDREMFRDICTTAHYTKFVYDEVLSPCGASEASVLPRHVPGHEPQVTWYYNGEKPELFPWTYPDSPPVEYYHSGENTNPPATGWENALSCGADGYFMSAHEVGQFVARMRSLLTPDDWNNMTSIQPQYAYMATALGLPVNPNGIIGGGTFYEPATSTEAPQIQPGPGGLPSGKFGLYLTKNGGDGGAVTAQGQGCSDGKVPGCYDRGCNAIWMQFPGNVTAVILSNSASGHGWQFVNLYPYFNQSPNSEAILDNLLPVAFDAAHDWWPPKS